MFAALSGPRIIKSAASFCTLLSTRSSVDPLDSMDILVLCVFAARHPAANGLRHVVRVFANELIEHIDRHDAGRMLAAIVADPVEFAFAKRNSNRNIFIRR